MTLSLVSGKTFGVIIRKGFTKTWSIETGINLVRRNYNTLIFPIGLTEKGSIDFTYTSYEIPIQGLAHIRLGENLYINSSLGLSLNAYPGDVVQTNSNFGVLADRNKKVQMALIANVGLEYRTKKSGYFYLGSSLYNSLEHIGSLQGTHSTLSTQNNILLEMKGNYLTLDIRYYFPN